MSFAQGLARGLSDMPNTIRRGQEQRRMRDLGDQLTSGIEEGFTPDSAKSMAAVLARDGHVDAAMRMLEKGSLLERQGQEDAWTNKARARQETEWSMEDDLREWNRLLAEMETLPPGQSGPVIEKAYSKFPDGHKGRVAGYNPETREYLMERDDGETWVATRAGVRERARALSSPQAFLEAKQAAEAAAAKRKAGLEDYEVKAGIDAKHREPTGGRWVQNEAGKWVYVTKDQSGTVRGLNTAIIGEDKDGNPIYGPAGRGISGARGAGGAGVSDRRQAMGEIRQIVGTKKGKAGSIADLTPEARSRIDLIAGDVGLEAYTNAAGDLAFRDKQSLETMDDQALAALEATNRQAVAAGSPSSVPILQTRAEFDALPPGSEYIRDGRRYKKPGESPASRHNGAPGYVAKRPEPRGRGLAHAATPQGGDQITGLPNNSLVGGLMAGRGRQEGDAIDMVQKVIARGNEKLLFPVFELVLQRIEEAPEVIESWREGARRDTDKARQLLMAYPELARQVTEELVLNARRTSRENLNGN